MSSGRPPFTFGPWRFPFRLRLRQYAYPQYVSPNTLRAPVFTRTNFAPPHQVDFQFPNVALQAFAQSRVRPQGATLDETVPSPQAHPVDFRFPNVVLQAFAQSLVHPVGATLDESVPAVFPRPIDFQFANVAALDAAQRLVKSPAPKLDLVAPSPQPRQLELLPPNLLVIQPTGKPAANPIFDRPAPAIQAQDFLYPNLVTLAPSVVYIPVGAVWGPPQPLAPPVDFQPANIALRTAVVAGKPVVNQVFDCPAVAPRQLDFQFPNLVLAPTLFVFRAPLISRQAPVVQPIDFQFPNLTGNIPVTGKPVFAAIFERPIPATIPVDLLPPNISLLNFAQSRVKPVGSELDEAVPQSPPHQLDFAFANVARLASLVKPTFAPIFERPIATSLPVDAPIPNLLTTTLSVVVGKPIIPQQFADRPAPQQRVQEFTPPNLPITAAAQAQVKPVGSEIDETVPSPQAHPVDFQFPNIALAPTLFVFRAPLISRPLATVLHVDAPLPNLLTTTLSVAPQKPRFAPIFEHPPAAPRSQDQAQPNLLVTLLSTPVGIPFRPNIFLMVDRRSPQAPPQDRHPVNNTIRLPAPPPPPSVSELPHQNPVFVTMGRLMTLQGDTGIPANAYVTEDGRFAYVAENGTTFYVQETL